MIRANAKITFYGLYDAVSHKEIEFRALERDSVSCFFCDEKIRGPQWRPLALIALTAPAFSTIDGLVIRAYYTCLRFSTIPEMCEHQFFIYF